MGKEIIKDINIHTFIKVVTDKKIHQKTITIGDPEDLDSYFERIKQAYLSVLHPLYKSDKK